MKIFIVTVKEEYLRDTQCVIDPDNSEESDLNWADFSAPGFIDCVSCETPEEACKIIAEAEGYNVRLLEAWEISNDWLQKHLKEGE